MKLLNTKIVQITLLFECKTFSCIAAFLYDGIAIVATSHFLHISHHNEDENKYCVVNSIQLNWERYLTY